jgi:predicted RNA-binding protein with PIN domain
VPDTTLYLFDGYNLFNAGAFRDRGELVDLLASYVAGQGVRGVVVFDGAGEEREVGPLSIRFASHADDLLERLAAENRLTERVAIVSSDDAVRRVSGQEVRKLTSKGFLSDLVKSEHRDHEQRGSGSRVGDRLDSETRERLERLRRGGSS